MLYRNFHQNVAGEGSAHIKQTNKNYMKKTISIRKNPRYEENFLKTPPLKDRREGCRILLKTSVLGGVTVVGGWVLVGGGGTILPCIIHLMLVKKHRHVVNENMVPFVSFSGRAFSPTF